MDVEFISRIIIVVMRIRKYIYPVKNIHKLFSVINIKTHDRNVLIERLKNSIICSLSRWIVHRKHKVYDDTF